MNQATRRGFIPASVIQEVRPSYPFDVVAWTPESTPRDIIDRAILARIQFPERPTLDDIFKYPRLAAELYLTRTCALNCEGCSVPTSVRWAKEQRQSVKDWLAGVQALYDRGLRAIKFIGGEVGTLDWLPEIAGFGCDLGMAVSIFSDGVPFLDDPRKFHSVMEETNGKVLWLTSVDFPPPTEEMRRATGRDEATARRFKAERGLRFIDTVKRSGGYVIGHMMVHKPNASLIIETYQHVADRQGLFSVGTMQVNAHLYQGREPSSYKQALSAENAAVIQEQVDQLLDIEDANVAQRRRTIATSRAHLATMATIGISQDIGCVDERIGPPAVFAIMPDGSLRGCPVIAEEQQIRHCPGCSYTVFRDGDPRWSRFLRETGRYVAPADRQDFPSLFYPHADNDYLEGYYYRV